MKTIFFIVALMLTACNKGPISPPPQAPPNDTRSFPLQSLDFFDAKTVNLKASVLQNADYDPTSHRILFYPWGFIESNPQSVFLAYDTTLPFSDKASYEAVDLNPLISPSAEGFGTGFLDNASARLYFVPLRKDLTNNNILDPSGVEPNDLAIRFDLTKKLSNRSAYETFSLSSLPNPPPSMGWITGAFADGHAYYTPYGSAIGPSPFYKAHGILLRYDASKDFTDKTAWEWFNLQRLNIRATGFQSTAVKLPWVYIIPYNPGTNILVRYNVNADFASVSSYETVDLTKLRPDALGYTGGLVVGDYLVFVPWRNLAKYNDPDPGTQSMSLAAAFDTRMSLTDPAAWSFIKLTEVDPEAKGGWQFGWVDNRSFVHFAPSHNLGTKKPPPFVMWDSTKPFSDPSSWRSYSSEGAPSSTGAAYDGTHAYLVPYSDSVNKIPSGLITRITSK